ncbi:MAG: hypothetical protein S4CHLAM2_09070 [Chlamydiales bacterium]|nr:hypothetical protein [Chlamydiales bacterium]
MTLVRSFFLLLLSLNCYAQIRQVNTMQEIMPYFEEADGDTIAIFDIDLVLIQPDEPAFQMPNIKRHRALAKEIFLMLTPEKRDLFLTLMAVYTHSILVDEHTPFYLQHIQQRGIPTMALTSNLTGQLGAIAHLESWKIERLKQVGIDFSISVPVAHDHTFFDLPSYRGYYSCYTEGVLFANGDVCPKGDVLTSFLSWAHLHPQRVIFIDDREHNLTNVEQALHDYDASIQFEGIHYLGAHNYPSTEISAEEFEAKWHTLYQQCLR